MADAAFLVLTIISIVVGIATYLFLQWRGDAPKRELAICEKRYKTTLQLISHIDKIESYTTDDEGFQEETTLKLKKNERILVDLHGLPMIEPRRPPAQYRGGSSGASFRIAKGVYWRVGSYRGERIQLPDEFQVISEHGTLHLTNLRAVYVSPMKNREWQWGKLLSYNHDLEQGMSIIHVSNRQKGSGFSHSTIEEETAFICFSIDAAIAYHNKELHILRNKMERESMNQLKKISSLKSEIDRKNL